MVQRFAWEASSIQHSTKAPSIQTARSGTVEGRFGDLLQPPTRISSATDTVLSLQIIGWESPRRNGAPGHSIVDTNASNLVPVAAWSQQVPGKSPYRRSAEDGSQFP